MICENVIAQVAGRTSKLCLVIASRLESAATMRGCVHVKSDRNVKCEKYGCQRLLIALMSKRTEKARGPVQ